MIKIINISDDDAPNIGLNRYAVKINDKLITEFDHERAVDGLEKCLRDAADAVEKEKERQRDSFIMLLQQGFGDGKNTDK
jgi:hypothetical protein